MGLERKGSVAWSSSHIESSPGRSNCTATSFENNPTIIALFGLPLNFDPIRADKFVLEAGSLFTNIGGSISLLSIPQVNLWLNFHLYISISRESVANPRRVPEHWFELRCLLLLLSPLLSLSLSFFVLAPVLFC